MNRLLISRHSFDKSFPFASPGSPHPSPLDDLDSLLASSPTVPLIVPPYPSFVASTSETVVAPCMTAMSPSVPRTSPTSSPTPQEALPTLRLAPSSLPAVALGPHARSSVYHLIAMARDPRNMHPMVTRHLLGTPSLWIVCTSLPPLHQRCLQF
jgi:hypothetical protein